MAKPTKTPIIEPEPLARVSLPAKRASDPSVLAAMQASLQRVEATLRLGLENISGQLRDTRPTPEEELAHMRTRLLQTVEPGLESRELTRYAERAWSLAVGLEQALTEARARRETVLAELEATGAWLAGIQVEDMVQLEHRRVMLDAMRGPKYACATVADAIAKAEPLVALARKCAARTVQAALTALREWRVADLTARLHRLRDATGGLRVPHLQDARLAALARQVAQALASPLPVPELVWPSGPDPFTPPVLREP